MSYTRPKQLFATISRMSIFALAFSPALSSSSQSVPPGPGEYSISTAGANSTSDAAEMGQAAAAPQMTPVPRGSKVELSGSVQAAPLQSTAAPSGLAANPYVLPIQKAAAYNSDDITSSLNYIFRHFPDAQNYAMYLQLMPWQIDLEQLGVHSQVLSRPAGTTVLLRPYFIERPRLGITAVVPVGLATLDPFKDPQPAGSRSGPTKSIFISLDGFAAPVPVAVANSIEASFIDGFTTRLVLGQYRAFWATHQTPSSSGGYGSLPQNFSIDIAKLNLNQQCLSQYSAVGTLSQTYPPYGHDGNGGLTNTYEQDIAAQLSGCPITSVGMLYGWQVAQEIERTDAASGDQNHTLLKAAWSLLKYRFPFVRIGEMTAFTLDYLNGVSQNTRIQTILNGSPANTVTDLNVIVSSAAKDPQIIAAKKFLLGFQSVTEMEFYALTQNRRLKPDERRLLLTRYYNFIVGFHEGLAKAADAHYNETFDLAFGIGYASGFRDGYSLGYANGYADGFANGNAAAWAAANVIIAGLQSQVASLQSQLASAQSAQNGGGSGSGFWNNIGGIASTVGSVIGTIASFF